MNFDNYKNQKPYPNKPHRRSACHCGGEIDAIVERGMNAERKPTFTALSQFCPGCGRKVGVEIEKNWYDFEAARTEYHTEDSRVYNRFKTDAIKEVGLEGHPKADKAYAYAWQQGHSAGFSEVFSYLQDIAEVLK